MVFSLTCSKLLTVADNPKAIRLLTSSPTCLLTPFFPSSIIIQPHWPFLFSHIFQRCSSLHPFYLLFPPPGMFPLKTLTWPVPSHNSGISLSIISERPSLTTQSIYNELFPSFSLFNLFILLLMVYLPHFIAQSMNGGILSVLSILVSQALSTVPDTQ